MPSFFDRVRETATDLGNQAQRGLDQGQAKLDERGMRKDCDNLAKQIGYLVWQARSQGASPDETELERLCGLLTAREADIAAVRQRAAQPPPQQQPQQQGWGQPEQQPQQQGWGQPQQPPGQWGAQQPPGWSPQQPQGAGAPGAQPAQPGAPGGWSAPAPPAPGAPAGRGQAGDDDQERDEPPSAPTWGYPPPGSGG